MTTWDELVQRLVSDHGMTEGEAARALDAVLKVIEESLADRQEVDLTGFGKFSFFERGPHPGIDPQTGQRIMISGGLVPSFSPGTELLSSLGGDPDEEYRTDDDEQGERRTTATGEEEETLPG